MNAEPSLHVLARSRATLGDFPSLTFPNLMSGPTYLFITVRFNSPPRVSVAGASLGQVGECKGSVHSILYHAEHPVTEHTV